MNENVKKMQVSGVRKMFEMAKKMKEPVDLSLGQPDFDVPPELKKQAKKAIDKGKNNYSQTKGIKPLRKKIKQKLNKKNKIKTSADNIIVTLGASGALSLSLTSLLNKGDEVLLIDPYFVLYKQLIIQNGAVPKFIETKNDFSLKLENVKEKITDKTKAIILNSPNNPTGKIYSKKELKNLTNILKEKDITLISDEVYEDFSYEKTNFSPGSVYENTLTINAFSKSYSMTGWRVGYMTGPEKIIKQATKLQQFNFVCSPKPFQYASIKALDYNNKPLIKKYKQKRDIIFNGLKENYHITKPDGAFYAFVKYPFKGKRFIEKCIENNLLVVPGNVFSEKNTHFRISFSNDNKTLKKGVEILNRIKKS